MMLYPPVPQMLKSVMSTPEGTALLRRIRDSLQG